MSGSAAGRSRCPSSSRRASPTSREADLRALQAHFALPDLSATDDSIANGTFVGAPGEPRPLALFTAERVDYSLARLQHYTGTVAEHFQNFVLLTNYQRYVDEFIALGRDAGRQGRLLRASSSRAT